MKVKDCIEFAVGLTHDHDLKEVLKKVDSGQELTEEEGAILSRYINGVNIAVDTIASRYYQNIKEVTVKSDLECRVMYQALDERVYEVVSVKEKQTGVDVDFYTLPFSLYLPKGNTEYVVRFKYLPTKALSSDDELEVLPFVPLRAIGYLMASDIYLSKSLYDEAKFWFNSFENEINGAVARRRMRTLNIKKLV